MAIVNSKSYYDDLLNDNVLFLQGTQFDLNKYLPTAPTTFPNAAPYAEDERGKQNSLRGHAIEGAFYLTTDTHRLYIGRKVTNVPDPNPYGIEINDIYPEEISSGIATVEDTTELAQVQTGGAAHDGDFYYIKGSNVLAVYEEDEQGGGHWQQVNSPTGIDSFQTTISSTAPIPAKIPDFSQINTSSYAKIKEALKPSGAATPTETEFWLKAGDNINLKASEQGIIEISSINSQSELNIEPSSASDNNAKIVLSDGINFNSEIGFEGKQDTTVQAEEAYQLSADTTVVAYKPYYQRSGSEPYTYTLITSPTGNPHSQNYYEKANKVIVTGPGINGTYISTLGTVGATSGNAGFNIAVQVKNGDTTDTSNKSITATGGANSILDPIITIGSTTAESYHFRGGTARIPIYTKDEVDTQINNSITSALNVTDALHYKGTISSYDALSALDDGNLANGDVYKASGKFSYNIDGNNSITIKVGDLLIAQGQETNGKIPSGSATWQVVPSGDEPLLVGKITNSSVQGAGPGFGFEDSNISTPYNELDSNARLDKRPLYVSIDNENSTLIRAAAVSEQRADNFKITLHHIEPVSNTTTNVVNITTATLITSSASSDSLGIKDSTLTFQAISSITRDRFGHIIDISGQTINLKHNYLTQLTGVYSTTTTSQTNIGRIAIGANDALGFSNSATKVNVLFGSETLKITNTESQLNMNLVWGSF